MPIQQKLAPPVLLFSVFAGWSTTRVFPFSVRIINSQASRVISKRYLAKADINTCVGEHKTNLTCEKLQDNCLFTLLPRCYSSKYFIIVYRTSQFCFISSCYFIFTQDTSKLIQAKRDDLAEIEDIGAKMEEAMILDNK